MSPTTNSVTENNRAICELVCNSRLINVQQNATKLQYSAHINKPAAHKVAPGHKRLGTLHGDAVSQYSATRIPCPSTYVTVTILDTTTN